MLRALDREGSGSLDPRTRLLATGLVLVAVLLADGPGLPLAVGAVSLAAARAPAREAIRRLAPALLMASVLLVVQALTVGSTPLGIPGVDLRREGLEQGLLMVSRVLGSTCALLLLCRTTPPHRLLEGLRGLGVPADWADLASLMLRYLFVFGERGRSRSEARRLRLGYRGARRALRTWGEVAGALVLDSVDQAARTAEAMRLRGWRGRMPGVARPLPGGSDLAFLLTLGVALAAVRRLLS